MQATAWILDVAHRAQRLNCDVPAGVRVLAAVEEAAKHELGVTLGMPLGIRALDTAPELLFLLPGGAQAPGFPSLAQLAGDDRGFSLYVDAMLGGWSPRTRDLDVFYFGDGPELAAQLAHLVMKGVKRGTAGWLEACEREGYLIPTAGLVSIVTDRFGHALCAIQGDRVERLRFGDVDASHAWIEGEGDRTLEDCRAGHLDYFHREAARLGLTFTEDAIIFFQHFRVLAVFGRTDP